MNVNSQEISLKMDITISAPLDLVWYAWVMEERVTEWFAPEAVVEAKEGGKYELYFVPGNTTSMNTKGCRITKLADKKELSFTWKGPDPFEALMNQTEDLTIVHVVFEEIDSETTKIFVEHTGFIDEENWAEAYNWHKMAWSGVLSSLKAALEKGEGNICCQPN